MARYVCLLRGINVSGARKIKMADLEGLCVSLGHGDVATYLQSGNVVLSSRMARARIGPSLSEAIARELGHGDVKVFVWTGPELAALVEKNPFVAQRRDPSSLYATIFARDLAPAAFDSIDRARFLPDELAEGERAVYVCCPNGYGRTKLDNAFFERALRMPATTRNWKTLTALLRMVRGEE